MGELTLGRLEVSPMDIEGDLQFRIDDELTFISAQNAKKLLKFLQTQLIIEESNDYCRFMEWVLELLPPQYDMDKRRRYSPQIPSSDGKFVWIETLTYNPFDPIFYTTEELFKIWKNQIG